MHKPARSKGDTLPIAKFESIAIGRSIFYGSLPPLLPYGLVQLVIDLDLVRLKENHLTFETDGHRISSLLVL